MTLRALAGGLGAMRALLTTLPCHLAIDLASRGSRFPARWAWSPKWSLLPPLWDYCRPSRHWLTPGVIKRRWFAVLHGYREALRRLSKGPQFLEEAEAEEANRQISRRACSAG
jgi:hypothetical protein